QRDHGVAPWRGARAAPALPRPRPAAHGGPPHDPASPRLGRGAGGRAAPDRLAYRHLARRHPRSAALPLRLAARPPGASRRGAVGPPPPRVGADRVAARRTRADALLAVDPAGDYGPPGPRPPRPTPLAGRARLPRTQGRAGPGSLRGPRLARLPSPRQLVHRRLRVPGRGAGAPFPPHASRPRPRPSRTPGLPPAGHSRCGLSAMFPLPSAPCPSRSPLRCSTTDPVRHVATSRDGVAHANF